MYRWKISALGLVGCLLLILQPLTAFGSKEKEESYPREEARIVGLYLLAQAEAGASASPAAGEAAAAHLFQRFQRQSDGIRFGGGRDFAMPIEERRVEERLSGSATGLNLLYYRIELTPKRVGPYISAEKISVSFPLEDLVDGERIRLQPAQYAILQGLKKTELASGLVRILSMDYRKGEFSVELELAQPGE